MTDGEVYLMFCLKLIINLSFFDELKTKPDRMHCICSSSIFLYKCNVLLYFG